MVIYRLNKCFDCKLIFLQVYKDASKLSFFFLYLSIQNTLFYISNMLHSDSSASLSINVRSASDLLNAQTIGLQDPYLQFTLNVEDKDSFQKTFTDKNGGQSATWNQSFTVPLNGEPNLFIEVFDQEASVDEVIGFCAIPVAQVIYAPGANLNGLFDIYDVNGNRAGLVNLQLAAHGFPNSEIADPDAEPVRGESFVDENHKNRVKSLRNKAVGVAVAGGLLGAGLAIGAGFLGKKLYDQQQAEAAEGEQAEELVQEE
jgi:hypothetical protein